MVIPFRLVLIVVSAGFFTLAVGSCVGVESFTISKLSSVVLR